MVDLADFQCLGIKELKQRRRRRQREKRKSNFTFRLATYDNNNPRQSRVLNISLQPLYDYDVKLPCFMGEVNTGERLFFLLSELKYSHLEFNSSKIGQHLTNWMRWNNGNEVWNAYWLPKWRFRSCRLRGCWNSLLAQLFFPWSNLWLVYEWSAEKSFRLDAWKR